MMGFDLAAAAFFAADKLGGTKRVAPPAGAGVLAGGPQPEPEDVVEEEVADEDDFGLLLLDAFLLLAAGADAESLPPGPRPASAYMSMVYLGICAARGGVGRKRGRR